MSAQYHIKTIKIEERKDGTISFADVMIDGLTVRLQNKISDGVRMTISGSTLIAADEKTVAFVEARIEAAKYAAGQNTATAERIERERQEAIERIISNIAEDVDADRMDAVRAYIIDVAAKEGYSDVSSLWTGLTSLRKVEFYKVCGIDD